MTQRVYPANVKGRITMDDLRDWGSCSGAIVWFKATFGDRVLIGVKPHVLAEAIIHANLTRWVPFLAQHRCPQVAYAWVGLLVAKAAPQVPAFAPYANNVNKDNIGSLRHLSMVSSSSYVGNRARADEWADEVYRACCYVTGFHPGPSLDLLWHIMFEASLVLNFNITDWRAELTRAVADAVEAEVQP